MKLRTFFSIVAGIALAIVVYVSREDIAQAWRQLPDANPWLILMIVPTQLLGYHFNTRMYSSYFRAFSNKLDYLPLYKLSLELNFVNNVFPSGGISTASYMSYRLKKWRVSTSKAALAVIARFAMTFVTFLVLLATALLFMLIGGVINTTVIFIAGMVSLIIVFIITISTYILRDRARITNLMKIIARFINWVVNRIHIKKGAAIDLKKVESIFNDLADDYRIIMSQRREILLPTFYALLNNLTEVLTIYWVYLAFGEAVNFGAVIIAYAVANFAGAVAAIPGGLGVYESMLTIVMVSAGVPAGLSLTVAVVYRIINMSVFLPIGYTLYHRGLKEGD